MSYYTKIQQFFNFDVYYRSLDQIQLLSKEKEQLLIEQDRLTNAVNNHVEQVGVNSYG